MPSLLKYTHFPALYYIYTHFPVLSFIIYYIFSSPPPSPPLPVLKITGIYTLNRKMAASAGNFIAPASFFILNDVGRRRGLISLLTTYSPPPPLFSLQAVDIHNVTANGKPARCASAFPISCRVHAAGCAFLVH